MYETSNEHFEQIVARAIDSMPEEYLEHLKNVAFVIEDEPTRAQLIKMKLRHGHTLFGLYEGIPQTERTNAYSGVLPDKITIFKKPIEAYCFSAEELEAQVKNTVWHEIAHHYGLDHDRIHELERKIGREPDED